MKGKEIDKIFYEKKIMELEMPILELKKEKKTLIEQNQVLETENESLKVQLDGLFLQFTKLQEKTDNDQVVEYPVEGGMVLGQSVEVDFIPSMYLLFLTLEKAELTHS